MQFPDFGKLCPLWRLRKFVAVFQHIIRAVPENDVIQYHPVIRTAFREFQNQPVKLRKLVTDNCHGCQPGYHIIFPRLPG